MIIKIKITIILFFLAVSLFAQQSDKIRVIFGEDRPCGADKFIRHIYNYFDILAAQDSAVTLGQVKAYLYDGDVYFGKKDPKPIEVTFEYGMFKLQVDSLGWVEIRVYLTSGIETFSVGIVPLPAVPRIGNLNAKYPVPRNKFLTQRGVIAWVECCGFDAKCNVLEYEVIRIASNNVVSRSLNAGGKFEESVQELIDSASSGDIYIVRNIKYRCPGADKSQEADDLIYDIE